MRFVFLYVTLCLHLTLTQFLEVQKKKKIIYSWYKRNYGTIIQMYLHMLLEYEYGSAEKCRVYKVALKALWFDLKYHQGNF